MGCWFTKEQLDTVLENAAYENASKAYSWDKRERLNPSDYIIEQLHDGETGRMPGTINGQSFEIRDCSNSSIFLLDYINTINIDDCTNCTIVLGPTSGSVFVRDCSECVLVVACGQFRTRDCRQLEVRLLCNTQPIIESSIRIRFSCCQLFYPQLLDQFKSARLSVFNNNWSEVHDFTPCEDEKNWTVAMPAVLPKLKLPSSQPLISVGMLSDSDSTVLPFTLGSVSPPGYRCLHEEPLLLLIYFSEQQHNRAINIVRSLQQEAGMSAVLYSKEVRIKEDEAKRVLGAQLVTTIASKLALGPVVALLVDAPYHNIEQAVSTVSPGSVYVAPNNGVGYNQANTFFSIASLAFQI